MSAAQARPPQRSPWFWVGMLLGSYGLIAGLSLSDAIGQTTAFILMVCATGLVVPMSRAGMARQKQAGNLTPAGVRYARRFLIAGFGYVLGLGLAITLHERTELPDGGTFLIALLPVLPIFVMIWAMARYLIEEEDEYLRHRTTIASLAGLGLVLAAGSFWGFLETFEVAPHIDAWWTFPVWAMGMGLAQCWLAVRDRTGGNP